MEGLFRACYTYGRLIKLSHTIFALPFALSAVILANRTVPVTPRTLFWILVAMVSARSTAMGFNRWADRVYDKMNPRTANRPSVTGAISPRALVTLIVTSGATFVLSARMLGNLCFLCSFPVLGVLIGYSYTKRFTKWCHLCLGFAIGLAPTGAWIAVTNGFDFRIVFLSIALMTYIAGFDILYACLDVEFDRKVGLFSLPATLGVERALRISAIIHGVTFISLLIVGILFKLSIPYYTCTLLIGVLLVLEHRMVKPNDLSKVPIAFYHVNSAVSVLLFLGVFLESVI